MDLIWSDDTTRQVRERIIKGKNSDEDIVVLQAAYGDLVEKMKKNEFLRRIIRGFGASNRIKHLINEEPTDEDLLEFFENSITPGDRNREQLNAELREIYDIMTSIIDLSKVDNAEVKKVLLGYETAQRTSTKQSVKGLPIFEVEGLPIPEEALINIAKDLEDKPKRYRNPEEEKKAKDDDWIIKRYLLENSNLPEVALYEMTKHFIERAKQSEEYKRFKELTKSGEVSDKELKDAWTKLVGERYRDNEQSDYHWLMKIAEHSNTPVTSLYQIDTFARGLIHKRNNEYIRSDLQTTIENRCQNDNTIVNENTRYNDELYKVGRKQNDSIELINSGVNDYVSNWLSKKDTENFRNIAMQKLLEKRSIEDITSISDLILSSITRMNRSLDAGEGEHQETEVPLIGTREDRRVSVRLEEYMREGMENRALALRQKKSNLQEFLDFIKGKWNELMHGKEKDR